MFPIEAFQATLKKLADILTRLEIRFHLTGGVTSIAYAEPRMTQDIDIVVDNERLASCLPDFISGLTASEFMFDETAIREAIQDRKMFQTLDIQESLKLVIYARELVESELQRSATIELFEGVFYPIASRVDTSIAKLLWVDQGSHKSRRDLRHLYLNASKEEQDSIEQHAKAIGKLDLFHELLDETDEVDF